VCSSADSLVISEPSGRGVSYLDGGGRGGGDELVGVGGEEAQGRDGGALHRRRRLVAQQRLLVAQHQLTVTSRDRKESIPVRALLARRNLDRKGQYAYGQAANLETVDYAIPWLCHYPNPHAEAAEMITR
jgi:hypothetical protein